MSHQVLARKWRPHNFTEIVGQEHVVQALVNALSNERLHHAYLFTGTRGVGKTTIARILAKALNCEARQGFEPCGQCPSCEELDAGRSLDLIEVDAASRTKVEDTRDLLENAQYAPHRGQYKVYLIDEVHMLSGHSFNALLKTLEEPPPHVKFLLATTDPQKIPVTVLSRCLQFNLKRLSPSQIGAQMAYILQQEGIAHDPAALQLLARAADGSMRDGLSLLDQAIVFGNGAVHGAQVSAMLGSVAQQSLGALLQALAQADATAVLHEVENIALLNPNFTDVLAQLLQTLHRIAIAQLAPQALPDDEDAEELLRWAERFSPEDIQLYYQIALHGQRDLEWAPEPRIGFEMALLRMVAFRPAGAPQAQAGVAAAERATPLTVKAPPPRYATAPIAQIPSAPAAQVAPPPATPSASTAATEHDWPTLVAKLKLGGLSRELANNCVLERLDDDSCVLLLDPNHQQLLSAKTEGNLRKALQDYFKKPLKVVLQARGSAQETPAAQLSRARQERQAEAEAAIGQDPNVQLLQERFDAQIVPGSITPVSPP